MSSETTHPHYPLCDTVRPADPPRAAPTRSTRWTHRQQDNLRLETYSRFDRARNRPIGQIVSRRWTVLDPRC